MSQHRPNSETEVAGSRLVKLNGSTTSATQSGGSRDGADSGPVEHLSATAEKKPARHDRLVGPGEDTGQLRGTLAPPLGPARNSRRDVQETIFEFPYCQTMPDEQPSFSVLLKPGCEAVPGYRLEAFLGRGQYGEVWKATGPGKVSVALKFIDLRGMQGLKEFRGIQRVKAVRHAHLMPITGLWMISEDGRIASDEMLDGYLPAPSITDTARLKETLEASSPPRLLVVAMLLANQTLEDRLAECKSQDLPGIPRNELLDYIEEAAKGIDFLNTPRHDLGDGPVAIQHCDVKPANLVLAGNSVLVCDFGLARLLSDVSSTATGIFGSAAYMSPETIAQHPGRASDQYSLAITYYELRTGRLPFTDHHLSSVLDSHRNGTLDFSGLPAAEEQVLRRATSIQPESRFKDCCELVRELRRAELTSGAAPRTVGHNRKFWATSLLAAALLLVCVAGLWVAFLLLAPITDELGPPQQRPLLVLRPETPQVFVDGRPIDANSAGRFPLPIDLNGPFELRIPAPDDEHQDYISELTIEQLARSDFRLEYEFPPKERRVPRVDHTAEAQQNARRALELADTGRLDEAVVLYKEAVEHDKQFASAPLPHFVLPGNGTRCLDLSPDGRWLFTGDVDGRLLRWDLSDVSAEPETVVELTRGTVGAVMASPDGRWVACGTSPRGTPSQGVVVACDLQSHSTTELLRTTTEIRRLAFGAGNLLAAAAAQSVEMSPDIYLWNLSEPRPEATRRLLVGHRENVDAIAFSYDGRWLYSGGFDDRVLRWDVEADNPQPVEIHHGESDIQAIVCHPSKSIVAFGGLGAADNLWLQESSDIRPRQLRGPLNNVEAVAFSGDGRRLVAADQDGLSLVWDVDVESPPIRLEGHSGIVTAAVFLPPGDWIATASWDRSVGLWDLRATTKTPLQLQHGDALAAVRASRDGRWLVTLCEDGVVRVWNVPRCKLVKRACDELDQIPLPPVEAAEPREAAQPLPGDSLGAIR